MLAIRGLLPLLLLLGCGTSKYDAEKEGGVRLEYGLAEAPGTGDTSSDELLDEAAQVIFERLKELGEFKYGVSRRGTSILVDMPGFDDSKMLEREKRIIGMTGRLEFHIVDEVGSEELLVGVSEKLPKDGPVKVLWEQVVVGEQVAKSYYLEAKDDPKNGRSGRDILKESLKMIEIPQDRVIGYEKHREVDEAGNPSSGVMWRTYYLERTAELTGAYLESAAVFNDEQTGQPYVSLDFNQAGGKLFEELTTRNVKRRLAIQVDDQVQSAPTIQEKIPGGRCRVTLGAYESADRLRRQAWDLVVVLRAGALPAPIRLLKEEKIAPH